ncbi:hypothetical protein UFOVP164_42 [uncultured Caudovirales phage]|uniref:Uncharacterized protein n=1 Tax=uncultured Caudovirales phage TaxID=2100421 RepID=A0A6J7XRQ2_9CAUD|nr:hypothetical protein UFOVP164_42 [uncultured Caudovirales phage]
MTLDGITDSIVDLLVGAGENKYLVFCESDPELTIEITGGLIVSKLNGKKTRFTNEIIRRAEPIIKNPMFDYK